MERPLVPLLAVLCLAALSSYSVAKRNDERNCWFPERWRGSWFQSGVRQQPITIQKTIFSTKGSCIDSDGDKFLIADEKSKSVCYRCVVIHEKHENVLQYKETYCSQLDNLYSLCSHITGDALLYSMFRQNAVPIPCPFSGYHNFSYNRGHGECKTPPSTMESCTQDSRLVLRYQACPDVYGSESAVEELQCLAIWKEGSSRYLVGKIEHGHVSSNEDRYRCFVYEKGSSLMDSQDSDAAYKVAQSGDATCNGLFSPMEGSRTMTLHKGASPSKCKFPAWLTRSTHWHSLDYRRTYSLHHRNTTMRVSVTDSKEEDSRIQCTEVKSVSDSVANIIGHYTVGCDSGYVCMYFYKRDAHVIEIQSGMYTSRQDEACSITYFDKSKLPYTTLVTTSPETQPCPHPGRFSVKGSSQENARDTACSIDFRSLSVGCVQPDTMQFRSTCHQAPQPQTDIVSSYTCHASWSEGENRLNYLITTPVTRGSHAVRRYCFVFTDPTGAGTQSGLGSAGGASAVIGYSTGGDTCSREVQPGVTGLIAFNITHAGSCTEANSSLRVLPSPFLSIFFLFYIALR